jgi:hypothetical protein
MTNFVCGGILKAAISELITVVSKDKRKGNGWTCTKHKIEDSCRSKKVNY